MRLHNIKYIFLSGMLLFALAACNNDDDAMEPEQIAMPTCDDGIMNGDETGVDCGGTCAPCGDGEAMEPDFTGTYAQVDHMGRPGINTVLSADMEGMPSVKDAFNVTVPSAMVAEFQAGFEARLEQYHDVYAVKLGLDPADVNYQNNILNLDATTLTTVLAADVLQVAPDEVTTYYNGTVGLTGRTLTDDVIDISLILLFGGETGDRFSGQDTDNDGMADLPRLTSDGVSLTATIDAEFPYVSNPQ
ncbi:DUF4331 family protein [Zeaxanthinibacter sp. PT1]|uniref:DUF4331 family protein n=1 Tax=Zeaxanthinibacter TaxID=561554 RepID=UPI00234AC87F|nr:DUF4331 family protein [Zeaxanthinibacter sp. PT1]MDC6352263.1 DUF4331 family protein [Zeaxanthinibacter sp. PT1]